MRIVLTREQFYTAAIAAVAIAGATCAVAQTYPSKPIRIIAAQTAGGATDLFARMLGHKLTEAWKQMVVVENRPGAAGAIGAEMTAKSPADGYTLLDRKSTRLNSSHGL